MKTAILLVTLTITGRAFASSLDARAACNADNCLRAVRGRLPSASSDCVSYLTTSSTVTTTVSPTITSPVTTASETKYSVVGGTVITSGPDPPPYSMYFRKRGLDEAADGPVKRDTPKTIPAYASACSGTVRYSSACSCVGAAPTPATVTATTTASTTATTYLSTKIAYTTVGVCDAAQNYGVLYGAVSYSPPRGTTDHWYVDVPANSGLDCCVACFRSKGCNIYEYVVDENGNKHCTFHVAVDGPVKDPNNAVCPYGLTPFQGNSDQYFGKGPCALGCVTMQAPDGSFYCA